MFDLLLKLAIAVIIAAVVLYLISPPLIQLLNSADSGSEAMYLAQKDNLATTIGIFTQT